ncbi:hypothetical protein DAPPUDRAFT_112080 [Daphnia pulex]|uniref:SGNH domain-containing protein n=1 Tax=Daphnia pulex TaxID=6669 RepID=E9HAX0_DAPPU|nr:hypothetical protein DAPPUDRAFT_112080 [Daphnia pulex]|eukprot:EFX71106.1 hypothetical protein DAPPUDRAFT_112080 [Daphnia pulex]
MAFSLSFQLVRNPPNSKLPARTADVRIIPAKSKASLKTCIVMQYVSNHRVCILGTNKIQKSNMSSLFKILHRLSTLFYTVSRRIILKVGNARVGKRAQLENWRTAQHSQLETADENTLLDSNERNLNSPRYAKLGVSIFIMAQILILSYSMTCILDITNHLKGRCQIQWLDKKDIVNCVDALSGESVNGRHVTGSLDESNYLNFVFIGDSRVRQIFFNFVKIIPDYDLQIEPKLKSYYKLHRDVNFTSHVLNFRLSFYWRPFLGENITDVVPQIIQNLHADMVKIVLIGLSTHHMIHEQNSSQQLYAKGLRELAPVLQRIATSSTRVIWLRQYPVIDFFGSSESHNTDIFSSKINQFNVESERILRNRGITIWNSGNFLVEEYIRSCSLLDRGEIMYFGDAYFSCLDYLHTGYVALSLALQLLVNELC